MSAIYFYGLVHLSEGKGNTLGEKEKEELSLRYTQWAHSIILQNPYMSLLKDGSVYTIRKSSRSIEGL